MQQFVLLLISIGLVGCIPAPEETVQISRGEKWVRSHPFQICAIAEGTVDIQQYKNMGFSSYMATNLANPVYPEKMFGAAAKAGLGWYWFYRWDVELPNQQFIPKLKEFVQLYPGFLGVNVGDETDPKFYPEIAKRIEQVKTCFPDAIVYHASLGLAYSAYRNDHAAYRHYLDEAVNVLKVDVLMYDFYPFSGETTDVDFYANAAIVRERALAGGIPYWTWLQGYGMVNLDGFVVQEPCESELRLQAFVSLAYGFSGFAYWTYAGTYKPYTNAILDSSRNLSPIGVALKGAITEIRNIGEVTKNLTSTGVFFCPSRQCQAGRLVTELPKGTIAWEPQPDYPIRKIKIDYGQKGFVIGLFKDNTGNKSFMVVNGNHGAGKTSAETAGTITINFDSTVYTIERLNRHTGKYEKLILDNNHALNQYVLPGGTGEFFRFVEQNK